MGINKCNICDGEKGHEYSGSHSYWLDCVSCDGTGIQPDAPLQGIILRENGKNRFIEFYAYRERNKRELIFFNKNENMKYILDILEMRMTNNRYSHEEFVAVVQPTKEFYKLRNTILNYRIKDLNEQSKRIQEEKSKLVQSKKLKYIKPRKVKNANIQCS